MIVTIPKRFPVFPDHRLPMKSTKNQTFIEFSNGGDRTPFDEEDWDDHGDPLEDDGRPGTNFWLIVL